MDMKRTVNKQHQIVLERSIPMKGLKQQMRNESKDYNSGRKPEKQQLPLWTERN